MRDIRYIVKKAGLTNKKVIEFITPDLKNQGYRSIYESEFTAILKGVRGNCDKGKTKFVRDATKEFCEAYEKGMWE